jgi:hypothetical protein
MKNAQVFNDGSHLCGNFCMGNSTVSTKRGNEGIGGVFISCFNRIGIKYFDGGPVVYLGDVLSINPLLVDGLEGVFTFSIVCFD